MQPAPRPNALLGSWVRDNLGSAYPHQPFAWTKDYPNLAAFLAEAPKALMGLRPQMLPSASISPVNPAFLARHSGVRPASEPLPWPEFRGTFPARNSNKKLQIDDDPRVQAGIDQSWADMVKRGNRAELLGPDDMAFNSSGEPNSAYWAQRPENPHFLASLDVLEARAQKLFGRPYSSLPKDEQLYLRATSPPNRAKID